MTPSGTRKSYQDKSQLFCRKIAGHLGGFRAKRHLLGMRNSSAGQTAFTNVLNWSSGETVVPALAKKVLVMFATHQSFLEPPTTGVNAAGVGAGAGVGVVVAGTTGAGVAAYFATVYAKVIGSYL